MTPARRSACAATALCVRAGARRGGGGGEEGGDGSCRGGGGYEQAAEQAEEASVPAARSQRNLVGVSSRASQGRLGLAAPAARARGAETRAPTAPALATPRPFAAFSGDGG